MIGWLWECEANQLTPTETVHLLARNGKMNQITRAHLDGTNTKNVERKRSRSEAPGIAVNFVKVSQSAEAE